MRRKRRRSSVPPRGKAAWVTNPTSLDLQEQGTSNAHHLLLPCHHATVGMSTQGHPMGHWGTQHLSQHNQARVLQPPAQRPTQSCLFFTCLETRQPSAHPAQGHPCSQHPAWPGLPVSETRVSTGTNSGATDQPEEGPTSAPAPPAEHRSDGNPRGVRQEEAPATMQSPRHHSYIPHGPAVPQSPQCLWRQEAHVNVTCPMS